MVKIRKKILENEGLAKLSIFFDIPNSNFMHLVARYPVYILHGGKCRHITLYEIYMGVGGPIC